MGIPPECLPYPISKCKSSQQTRICQFSAKWIAFLLRTCLELRVSEWTKAVSLKLLLTIFHIFVNEQLSFPPINTESKCMSVLPLYSCHGWQAALYPRVFKKIGWMYEHMMNKWRVTATFRSFSVGGELQVLTLLPFPSAAMAGIANWTQNFFPHPDPAQPLKAFTNRQSKSPTRWNLLVLPELCLISKVPVSCCLKRFSGKPKRKKSVTGLRSKLNPQLWTYL